MKIFYPLHSHREKERGREKERKGEKIPASTFRIFSPCHGQRELNQVLFINYLSMFRAAAAAAAVAAGGTFFELDKALIRNLKSRK